MVELTIYFASSLSSGLKGRMKAMATMMIIIMMRMMVMVVVLADGWDD